MTIDSLICQAPNCNRPRDLKQRSSLCTMHRVRRSRFKSFDLPLKIKDSLPEGIVKKCKKHGYLNIKQIYYNVSGKYAWPQCIECKKIANRKFLDKTPSRHRNAKLREKYEDLLLLQKNLCAICNKPELAKSTNHKRNKKTKRLALDHCHSSNKIRGLLCHECNTGLGKFKDSVETLQAAINYLKLHQ